MWPFKTSETPKTGIGIPRDHFWKRVDAYGGRKDPSAFVAAVSATMAESSARMCPYVDDPEDILSTRELLKEFDRHFRKGRHEPS